MLVSVLFLLVLASGLTTIGPSEEKEAAATGFVQPTGKPVDTLKVDCGADAARSTRRRTP